MNKEEYIKIVDKKFDGNTKEILLNQIERYYNAKEYKIDKNNYNIGDDVFLKKGTLLHGTYKNIDGLKEMVKDGLVCSFFTSGRLSKYPGCVGLWNLKKDYYLKDYINFYSGCTVDYKKIDGEVIKTEVISYNDMNNLLQRIDSSKCFRWYAEQTKEARFMPSLVQNEVQIGIIINGNNSYIKELLKGDILNPNLIKLSNRVF